MHIKLDSDGKVLYGKFLIKANTDLAGVKKLEAYQLEGYGPISHYVCCYSDAEAMEVMSIMAEESITAELIPLQWHQETIDNVGSEVYESIKDVYDKLVILKIAKTIEANVQIPVALIFPPQCMNYDATCKFTCNPVNGTPFSTGVNVMITGTEANINHLFMLGGNYTVEAIVGECKTSVDIVVDPDSTLAENKRKKIKELDTICNNAVLAGFKSWCLGKEYTYDFDYEAQINFSGTLNGISAGLLSNSVTWKTKEKGPMPHTIDQFKTLFMDGMLFKQQTIGKYWQLKQAVATCKTLEDVEAINW